MAVNPDSNGVDPASFGSKPASTVTDPASMARNAHRRGLLRLGCGSGLATAVAVLGWDLLWARFFFLLCLFNLWQHYDSLLPFPSNGG